MMMKDKFLKEVSIGQVKIEVSGATESNVVLKVTDTDDHGVITVLIKLNKDQLGSIYDFIMHDGILEYNKTENLIIENIHSIRCEYSRRCGEKESTHRQNDSKDSQLQIITIGGHCILSLNDGYEKHYLTISFKTYDAIESIKKLRNVIRKAMMEFESEMMKF